MIIHEQETFRIPNKQDQKRHSPHHIVIRTLGIQKKEGILKATREKGQVTYKTNCTEQQEIKKKKVEDTPCVAIFISN
jgi:hypothetical protein